MPAPPGRRAGCVRGRYWHFAEGQGLGEVALGNDIIESFVVTGLDDRAPSTRGTYRSVLRRQAALARPSMATPFAASPAKVPYTMSERAELWSIASAQHKAWRRDGARTILALGIGAGLRSGEITALRWRAVTAGERRSASIVVNGHLDRTVTVDARYASFLLHAAGSDPDAFVFHPGTADRSYHNFVNGFCATLDADRAAPKLTVARCRSSFIGDHFGRGTELSVLMAVTGINEVESLLRYARHVDGAPQSKAALRARLMEETSR